MSVPFVLRILLQASQVEMLAEGDKRQVRGGESACIVTVKLLAEWSPCPVIILSLDQAGETESFYFAC